MTSPEKRRPGQSNAEYERRENPNADFLGAQSLSGGGNPSLPLRIFRALSTWLDRHRAPKSP